MRRNTLEHRGEGVDRGREKWSRERSVISPLLRLLHHTVTHPSIPHPLPLVQGFRCLVWIQLSRTHSTSPTISFTIEISFPSFNLNLPAVFIFVIHCLGSLCWRCSLFLIVFLTSPRYLAQNPGGIISLGLMPLGQKGGTTGHKVRVHGQKRKNGSEQSCLPLLHSTHTQAHT